MTGVRLARDISQAVPQQHAFAVEARLSPLEEVVLAQVFEFEALMNGLERRGLITKAAVLDEIKRLRAQAPEAK
ncbi:MAG TPA: hypothetical protein VLG48_12320 [Candidatus Methylomirabilis sp.]|nr:hypothetical protein [Candidatus Methylomirabilis sp.]